MKEWILENTTISEELYDEIMLFEQPEEIAAKKGIELKTSEDVILYVIISFTSKKPTLLTRLLYRIKKQEKKYSYQGVEFELLYDYLPDENLFTPNRIGQCHKKSYQIGVNSNLDVITAKCKDYRDSKEYLHSFLYNDKTNKVLDYTLNIIMDKDDYYRLLNVVPIKIIKNSDLKRLGQLTTEALEDIGEKISIKEFFCFPEEIKKAITPKNK